MVPAILDFAASWTPDLIVRTEQEYGGCIAVEILGVPHAAVGVNAIGDFMARHVAGSLDELRTTYVLPPDPDLRMPHRYLTLRPFPPRFQDPDLPVVATTHFVRPLLGDRSGPEGLPVWVATLSDQPVAYVGMGTIFNDAAIFRAFLAGLRDEAQNLIVTVGRNLDPANFSPQPENAQIERYIPLSLVLPYCDLAVTNGGSGTLTAALAHGRPVVVVPVGADQPVNAALRGAGT